MKTPYRNYLSSRPTLAAVRLCLISAWSLLLVPANLPAAYLSTTNNQGSSSTTGWNAAIWKTNSAGTLVSPAVGPPVAGNTYSCIANGVVFSASTANTIIRNPFATGTTSPQTFPGDSLTLYTNTEIRFKQVAAGNVPTCNFPGVGGNPGLILDGGLLNGGDDTFYPVTGLIRVDSQSYFALGNNGGQAPTGAGRHFNVMAKVTGSGNLLFFNGSNYVAQVFAGTNETYSGQWIIKSAWVQFTGTNSMGTNSTVVVDPYYVLPLDPGIVDIPGPAEIEPGYEVNSAGTLTLVNGGWMRLHQNCAFTAVTIEGTPLSAGTHYYSELLANFPNNFRTGGSGSITIQPYGAPPAVGPQIATQPLPQALYAGATAHFTSTATGPAPLVYQWQKDGVALSDIGNLAGSTNTTLTVSSVSSGDVGNYTLVVTNQGGSITSSPAALTLVVPSGELYETAVRAANPVAFYQFNETADPAIGNTLAYDFAGGYNGTYGTAVLNGNPAYSITGPGAAAGYPGFASGNAAAEFLFLNTASHVTLAAPWNLNTNTVTITAWINPIGAPALSSGVVFCRGGGTVAGLNFSPATDAYGNATLAYTWDNEWETYNWNTGLVPPQNQWSFVALVVTPTNATIHLMNTNGLLSASRQYPHVAQAFGAGSTTLIGDDSAGTGGNRVFNGVIDDVAIFNTALSKDQLLALYTNASDVVNYAPTIGLQPTNEMLYAGQTAVFAVTAGGTEPLTYQWQAGASGSGVYSSLTDGGRISGSATPVLTIASLGNQDSMDYVVTVANPSGSITSVPANLFVSPVSPAENIVMAGILQPAPNDWDTGPNWSDGQAASVSAVQKPGSTYELMPLGGLNTRMRTPQNPTTAIFPGDALTLDGNAIWTNNPGTNGATAEIRFKQPPNQQPPNQGLVPGTVIFKKLVMNGGQLDAGNEGVIVIQGEIDVLTNAPVYSDSGNDRGYRIDAWLTGGATSSIEYHGYNQAAWRSNYVNNLNIAGNSNTFSGKWNIVIGTLLGTGTNGLGTNDILIGVNAALETTYDVNNTNANLILSGRMYLHQNDTFKSVFVNGIPLGVGTYTFAQLNALSPTNFPSAWMPQTGATSYTNGGSGSITVLVQPAPIIVQQPVSVSKYPTETAQFTVAAQGALPLSYQWRQGGVNLTDSGNLFGSGTTNLTITNIVSGNGGNYDVVVTNSVGSVTSLVAVLTVNPTGPPLNLTLNFDQGAGPVPIQQGQNLDWNTITNWSDGKAASLSALSNPGSTYEVIAGARLRSPAGSANSIFPGGLLTVDGDSTWVDNNGATIGELRFKHANPGTNLFPKLVMNGGQLDNGDNGLLVIQGEIDIRANTPIYVDSSAGQDRGYQMDAWLTGNGGIEFHQFSAGLTANLNVTGTTNTFSGPWNIVQGCVLGSGLNSLGPNSIIVGANGALETLYDLNSPSADLVLNGPLFLHQNDTLRTVTVNGIGLVAGLHPFSELSTAFPMNFPATWQQQMGSSFFTGSGSLHVLVGPTVGLQFLLDTSGLHLTWSQGVLLEADDVTGPWTTNTTAISPFTVTPTEARKFYRVLVGTQ